MRSRGLEGRTLTGISFLLPPKKRRKTAFGHQISRARQGVLFFDPFLGAKPVNNAVFPALWVVTPGNCSPRPPEASTSSTFCPRPRRCPPAEFQASAQTQGQTKVRLTEKETAIPWALKSLLTVPGQAAGVAARVLLQEVWGLNSVVHHPSTLETPISYRLPPRKVRKRTPPRPEILGDRSAGGVQVIP